MYLCKSPRFKSSVNRSLFILIVYSWQLLDEVTWPHIWEGEQYIIKTKTTFRKARQIQNSLNHCEVHIIIIMLSYLSSLEDMAVHWYGCVCWTWDVRIRVRAEFCYKDSSVTKNTIRKPLSAHFSSVFDVQVDANVSSLQ